MGLMGPTPMRAAVPPAVQIASPPTDAGNPVGAVRLVPLIVTNAVDVPAPYQCGPYGLIALGMARLLASKGSVLNGTPAGSACTARLLPAV